MAYSYAARVSLVSPDDLFDRAVIVKGPYRLNILNVTEDGDIWVNVEGRVGVDAGSVVGVNSEQVDGFLRDIWKSLGRWGIRQLDSVTVTMTTIRISSENDYSTVLATLDMSPMSISLTTEPPSDLSWLTTVTVPVHISPTHNLTTLMKFARDSWLDGIADTHVHVDQAVVQGGSLHEEGWRRSFEQQHTDIHRAIRIKGGCSLVNNVQI